MTTPKSQGRDDGHVIDYSQITEKIILGSDLCKGGVCLIHGEEFKRMGITVEINLSAENNEMPPKDIESYTWLPVVDGHAPSQEQLDLGSSVVNEAVRNKKIIFIHCKNGHGRSPTLVAAYLIRFSNMALADAEALIKKKRPEIHIEDIQHKALSEFEKRWSK